MKKKDFDYKRMVDFMYEKWLPDMDEWQERFIKSMKAKLMHPDAAALTIEEVAEFLSRNERIKIVEVWNALGL